MNPDTSIRPWLLACGAQYGIREAHDYRFPDAKTRQHEMYCTYKMISSEPNQVGYQDLSTKSGYDVSWKSVQKWYTIVEIDLYNSQDGLFELASFVVAQNNKDISAIFNDQCSLIDVVSLTNESTFDDERIDYHHKLIVRFEEDIEFVLDEINAIVETIDTDDAIDIS